MTKSVSGMNCGVNSGFSRGAKAVEESERKYIDSLASMSNCCQLYTFISRRPRSATFVISIKYILVGVSQGKFIGNHGLPLMSVLWAFGLIRG